MKTARHLVKGPPFYWGDPMLSMMTQARFHHFSVGLETRVSNCTKNIDWERAGLSKDKWEDVVKAFGDEFKPCQTVMQSWYQLGNLYSSHCKDQTELGIWLLRGVH